LKERAKDIELLSKPLNSEVDHLEILFNMYDKYMESRNELSNLMRYYLNGLDEIPTLKVKEVWNKDAYNSQRELFINSYPELLEILQHDYKSFKYNFRIIKADEFNAERFKEYPLWSEYYDFDELNEIEEWGYNKESILQELKTKEIENQHPYYTAPIESFPLERMRYFTRSKFRTINNIELDGAIMNTGELVIMLFLGNDYEILNRNPLLHSELKESVIKIANYYKIQPEELSDLTFETIIPKESKNRIKGIWKIENET
jgi:hypothetical protein